MALTGWLLKQSPLINPNTPFLTCLKNTASPSLYSKEIRARSLAFSPIEHDRPPDGL